MFNRVSKDFVLLGENPHSCLYSIIPDETKHFIRLAANGERQTTPKTCKSNVLFEESLYSCACGYAQGRRQFAIRPFTVLHLNKDPDI
jgi:hypothetical protein